MFLSPVAICLFSFIAGVSALLGAYVVHMLVERAMVMAKKA